MRHAEAQTPLGIDDHARRLTGHGAEQAKKAACILSGWGVMPEVMVCSDAARAVETSRIVLDALKSECDSVLQLPFLYQSYTTQELIDGLAAAVQDSNKPGAECVMCVGHNPDLSYRADALMAEPLPAAFPTSGVLVLGFDAERWSDITARSAFVLRSSFL